MFGLGLGFVLGFWVGADLGRGLLASWVDLVLDGVWVEEVEIAFRPRMMDS